MENASGAKPEPTTKGTKSNIIAQKTEHEEKQAKLKQLEAGEEDDQPKKKSPWIDAWNDNVAGMFSLSQLMQFCDLKMDGDYKLVICDLLHNFSNKTKVIFQ